MAADYRLYEDEIKEHNEDIDELSKELKSTIESIKTFFNVPDHEYQIQVGGFLLSSAILASKERVDLKREQIIEYLNDENMMRAIRYYKYKYGDIEEKMKNCLKDIDEYYKLTDTINEIMDNQTDYDEKIELFEECEEDIIEFNEGLTQAIPLLKDTNDTLSNTFNAPDIEEQLIRDGDMLLNNALTARSNLNSYKNEIKGYLDDEILMEAIAYYGKDYGDIKERMITCLNYIEENDRLVDELVKMMDEIHKPKKLDDTTYKTNNSRILDL